MLTDHLQRDSSDYEAFNLLLECFYRTQRYAVGTQVAHLMIDEAAPSDCFVNNGLLCSLLSGSAHEDFIQRATAKRNPFITYNLEVLSETLDRVKMFALFEGYRFGLPSRRENTLGIELNGQVLEFKEPVVTIGRIDANRLVLPDTIVSRRHCAIVNYLDDVWIYDLGSTHGVWVDGERIDRKTYLGGVHAITLGETKLTVRSKSGLLV